MFKICDRENRRLRQPGATTEHASVAICRQLRGRELGRLSQAGAAGEHKFVASSFQFGDGERWCLFQAGTTLKHAGIASLRQLGGRKLGRLRQSSATLKQTSEAINGGDCLAFSCSVDKAHHASAGGDRALHDKTGIVVPVFIGSLPKAFRVYAFQQNLIALLFKCDIRIVCERSPCLAIIRRVENAMFVS